MDDARIHDPFLVMRYAIRNKLLDTTGWEWTKHYIDSDRTLNHIVHAYKASKFLKNIKFGVEVPQSSRHAFQMDKNEGTNVWRDAMEAEVS